MLHLEILVEDSSGEVALRFLIPKIMGDSCTFDIHKYKGIGKIPARLSSPAEAKHRFLLTQLPRLIRGYGKTFAHDSPEYRRVLVVVCDLDSKDYGGFLGELSDIRESCDPRPEVIFWIAIEEGEAWLLGDRAAVLRTFPTAKMDILNRYTQDSICGTWELLADAVYPGGHRKLKQLGYQKIGEQKHIWAREICPNMNIDNNISPSFTSGVVDLRALT